MSNENNLTKNRQYIFPIVVGIQVCILAWMYAYSLYASDYTPDWHEEERKRIIELAKKELSNTEQLWINSWTGKRAITSNFTSNQKKSWNAQIVKAKWPNSDILPTKSTTGASVDTLKSGTIPTSVKKECNQECKVKVLVKNGINETIAKTLVSECKKQDKEVVNCIKLWASISMAESGGWDRCYRNSCFGMWAWAIPYESIEEWVKHWVEKWGKYWYKQKNPSSFYSNKAWVLPRTRYCLSEIQPDWTHLGYCKNWYKHSWSLFNSINKEF